MKLYEAINTMRELTAQGKTFSFSFMSFNDTNKTSEGVIEVEKAYLRKKAHSFSYKNADILIPYYDCMSGQATQFYLPLLMVFNGQKISIR
jgi:hypothetical protein